MFDENILVWFIDTQIPIVCVGTYVKCKCPHSINIFYLTEHDRWWRRPHLQRAYREGIILQLPWWPTPPGNKHRTDRDLDLTGAAVIADRKAREIDGDEEYLRMPAE